MNPRVVKVIISGILLIQSIFFVGCFSTGFRFYSGNPRPRNEVALFTTGGGCQCFTVEEEGQPAKSFYYNRGSEILPGHYVLCCGYISTSGNTTSNGAVNVELKAQAGHLYFIYPEFPAPKIWNPTVIDISRDEDYKKVPDEYREELQNWVKIYIEGERPIIKQDSDGMWG
jgi:hypothetical protein